MRYLILGATEVRDEQGEPVPLGGHRLRALLAALALHARSGTAVPVDVLIDEVWASGDALPGDAPAALQALVGRLRRALGKDAVESLPGGYRLNAAADDIDLCRFERLTREGAHALAGGDPDTAARLLREALALWRGPALADLSNHGSAARPEALHRTALQSRIAADLALGHAAGVLPELRELAAGHPLDEPLQALRLRALRDAGRTAEALEAYEAVRREIADRLGTDPGTELRTLHAELLAVADGTGGTEGRSGTEATGGADEASGRGSGAPGGAPDGTTGGSSGSAPDAAATDRASTDRAATDAAVIPDPAWPPGNLRARLTSFVGRENDLDTLSDDLTRSRLVTLTGPGGSGKTRLAEQLAEQLVRAPVAGPAAGRPPDPAPAPHASGSPAPAPHAPGPPPARGPAPSPAPASARPNGAAPHGDPGSYVDGAWLVELAPLDHPAAIPGAVLSALGRRETTLFTATPDSARVGVEHAVNATERLVEHLAHRRLLLVLDNCEHVIDAAATLAETLLARCPGLVVLATSREPLGVPGERVRPVEPLPPAPAHRLFAERGAAARPGFATEASAQDMTAVDEICRRLDGLPLSIELAAARLRSLTPRQIADRLDDRFRLLTSGSRTVLPRQQTLRAVVDWSWDLLDERERAVLRRISVFSGGCTLSAAEYVCSCGELPEEAVLDVLGALVDKSLLIADRPPAAAGTGMRYRMLETIHAYCRERAAAHPAELARAETRHTEQILRFVTAAEPRIRSADQLAWLPRVEADLDNIRAVLHRSLQARDTDAVATVILAMGWFWWLRNYRDEGGEWIARALRLLPAAHSDRDREEEYRYREFQLLRYFLLHEQYGEDTLLTPEHRTVARELLELFRTPSAESARFPGLLWPFTAYLVDGLPAVGVLIDQGVAHCRALAGPWEVAVSLLFRANLRVDTSGGLADAVADLAELDTLAAGTGDRWVLGQLRGLRAMIETMRGHYEAARAEYEAALGHAQALGALTEMPFLLTRIAENWYRQGDTERAEKLTVEAMEEAERLNVTDVSTYGGMLLAFIALDSGDPVRARELHSWLAARAGTGTLPSMFHVAVGSLNARITAAEGEQPAAAVRQARDALRLGTESGTPEWALADALLGSAAVVSAAIHPGTALRLADAARAMRGELAAGVPELRLDGRLRAEAGAAEMETAEAETAEADAGDLPPLTAAEAVALLDGLLAELPEPAGSPEPEEPPGSRGCPGGRSGSATAEP